MFSVFMLFAIKSITGNIPQELAAPGQKTQMSDYHINIPQTLAPHSLLYYNLPFVGLVVPGDKAPEDESGGDKLDRHKCT